jgi:hypothetical protein
VIKDQYSQDDGLTWNSAIEISALGNEPGPIKVTSTYSGELLLEQLIEQDPGNFVLRNWKWAEDQWTLEESLDLNLESGYKSDLFVNTATSKGIYAVVYSAYKMDEIKGLQKCYLYFVNRSLVSTPNQTSTPVSPIPAENLTITEQTAIPSGTPTLPPTVASQIQTLITITPLSPENINNASVSYSSTQGLLFGVVMGVLTVSIFFGIVLLVLRNRRQ